MTDQAIPRQPLTTAQEGVKPTRRRKRPPAKPAEPPREPVHLYFLTSTGEVRSGERYRYRNGEWRSALTGCVPRLKVAKWETETSNG